MANFFLKCPILKPRKWFLSTRSALRRGAGFIVFPVIRVYMYALIRGCCNYGLFLTESGTILPISQYLGIMTSPLAIWNTSDKWNIHSDENLLSMLTYVETGQCRLHAFLNKRVFTKSTERREQVLLLVTHLCTVLVIQLWRLRQKYCRSEREIPYFTSATLQQLYLCSSAINTSLVFT